MEANTYNINDLVLYGVYGVCRITDISTVKMGKDENKYFILNPVNDERSTVYIPVDNATLTSRMRRILSSDEIYSLIKSMPDQDTMWIEDESERKNRYKQILSGGDRTELVRLIKTLYIYQQEKRDKGRKLHYADEYFLKEAEKMLYDEFAHVLKIERDQVLPLITEQISLEEKI